MRQRRPYPFGWPGSPSPEAETRERPRKLVASLASRRSRRASSSRGGSRTHLFIVRVNRFQRISSVLSHDSRKPCVRNRGYTAVTSSAATFSVRACRSQAVSCSLLLMFLPPMMVTIGHNCTPRLFTRLAGEDENEGSV